MYLSILLTQVVKLNFMYVQIYVLGFTGKIICVYICLEKMNGATSGWQPWLNSRASSIQYFYQ